MIKTQMNKTFRSYNQNQLKIICDKLCDQIDNLFDILDIQEIQNNGKMYVGKCPIHGGDNKSAFNLYPDGESYRGNWKCRTHNCEKIFKPSIIGFIRGILSNKKYNWQQDGDKIASFEETVSFVEKFLKQDINGIKISSSDIEKKKFTSIIQNIIIDSEKEISSKISRTNIRKSLVMPSDYFLNRGFQESILDKYDVGLCDKEGKEMYQRCVVPIYDMEYKYMVGCTGRSIFDKCKICGGHHDPIKECPCKEDAWKYSKWKHNYQFKSQNHLYNIWFAKKYILESTKVILVESPGNVWRLEENGIKNSVAMFGSNLSDKQKIILDGSGAMTIISIMDNDEAGQKAAKLINDKCKNTYNIINIKISKPDLAEMTKEEIDKEIRIYL